MSVIAAEVLRPELCPAIKSSMSQSETTNLSVRHYYPIHLIAMEKWPIGTIATRNADAHPWCMDINTVGAAIIFSLSLGSVVYFMAYVIRGKAPKRGHQ
jgi:hypothetical protein